MTPAEIHARVVAAWHRAVQREKVEAEILKRIVIPDAPVGDSAVIPPALRAARHKRSMKGRATKRGRR